MSSAELRTGTARRANCPAWWSRHRRVRRRAVRAGCEWKGFRSIESYNVPFTVDKKITQARLTGPLTVYGGGHGEGGVVGRPYADIIWTGDGGVFSDKYTYRYESGGVMETGVWQSTNRSAAMSGVLGPMGFDPELSGASFTNFKPRDMQRMK